MAQGNNVTVVGNITRDPELRFTPTGQAVASFGLAVNRRWQNRQTQEWEEATSFFDVTCWAQMAENVSESLPKGVRILVGQERPHTFIAKQHTHLHIKHCTYHGGLNQLQIVAASIGRLTDHEEDLLHAGNST